MIPIASRAICGDMNTGAWRNRTPDCAIAATRPAAPRGDVVEWSMTTASAPEPRDDRRHQLVDDRIVGQRHVDAHRRPQPRRRASPRPSRRAPRARAPWIRFDSTPSTASPRRSIPSTIALPSSPVPRNATVAITASA